MPNNAALIYCRISRDREGAGLGVDRQRTDCEALARRLNLRVVGEFIDNDVSAYSGKPRPGYRALLAALDQGTAGAVLVWHTDRLHRSPRELEEYVDLCERRRITTQTVQAGELDLATPSGRAVARTLGAWARYEVEHKGARTRAAQEQAARAGKWHGGAQPLGWHLNPDGSATLDRDAARRIRKASTDVLAGVSVGSIVTAWNDAGFTTSTGRPWSHTGIRQVLTRARNAGLVDYNGEIVATSSWPAIVGEDVWRAVVSKLTDPTRRCSTSNRAKWLLAGIAMCGATGCGLPLRSASVLTTDARGHRTVYRCRVVGKGHVARDAFALDGFIDKTVRARLAKGDMPRRPKPGDTQDVEALRAEGVALRSRLDQAAKAFAVDGITDSQLVIVTRSIRERLDEITAALSPAPAEPAVVTRIIDADDPVKAWHRASLDDRRVLLRELATITVLPKRAAGRDFDPDAVDVTFHS